MKQLDDPVPVEPPRKGEGLRECTACNAPDEAYIWVGERWRVRAMDRPTGLPMVLILESRTHLDLGDLPNLLAAELGVMTVRLERAIRSLDGVARVHVNRWGDGSAHLHMWFLARPYGRLQLRGTFLSLWDSILPPISEAQWRENLALVAAWLAEFGGRPLAEPPRIQWQAPSSLLAQSAAADAAAAAQAASAEAAASAASVIEAAEETPEPAPEPTASAGQTDGDGAPAADPVVLGSDTDSPADTEPTGEPALLASATNEPADGASTAPAAGTAAAGTAATGTSATGTSAAGISAAGTRAAGAPTSGTSASAVVGTEEPIPGGSTDLGGAAARRDRAGSTDVEATPGAANETAPEATRDSANPDSATRDSAEADSANPDSANPDSANPDSANPDSANPDSANPDSAEPGSANPGSAEPDGGTAVASPAASALPDGPGASDARTAP